MLQLFLIAHSTTTEMIPAQRGLLNLSPIQHFIRLWLHKISLETFPRLGLHMESPCNGTNDELFIYTSGRFLYNEQRRLEERRINFDVAALKHAAEQHVGQGKITNLRKLAEGGFNRVFLLTTEDGFQAVAKVPYMITVPKHYTTASEVATTDLLRSKGIPVPRILGWSADPNNSVGAEYIIMEKASGIPLETRWFNLSKQERHHLVTSLVDIEAKIFDIPFGHFGSIYYRNDVPSNLQQDLYVESTNPAMSSADERFCIGPTTDYMFWYGKRAELGIDRGPYLTPGNIFICPETHKVSCIIDWQHTTLLPLLLATGHPPMLQSPDHPPPQTLEKPVLPDDYDSLSLEEKSQADELHRRRVLFHLYMVFNGGLNKRHLSGMRDPRVLLTQHLVERAEKQWSGDTFSLKGALIRITENWDHFSASLPVPVPCPISFTRSEIDTHYEQEPTWFQMNSLVEYWKSELQNLCDDGWVRTEAYEDAVKKNMELKQVLLDGSDTPEEERCVQEQWPFQDHEEEII
ncbi:phosphotransferase enzyme family protein [Histoplasma capsulatum H143]|uniref:Phosphotransferase enzyme family protein n=1 Tax=Ajellomyces capsulatus (strain H143) TaxID=544712 RepID=C6HPF5_AJECH|nr:phosphotransferase enzyme family protein [Histoplasma capsulatum H143]